MYTYTMYVFNPINTYLKTYTWLILAPGILWQIKPGDVWVKTALTKRIKSTGKQRFLHVATNTWGFLNMEM